MRNSLLICVFGLFASPALADGRPLSAIDWLSRSIEESAALPVSPAPRGARPAPISRLPTEVTTRPLRPPEPETTGLVAAADLGLPADLWGVSTAEEIAAGMGQIPADLPWSARDLLRRVVISRQASPAQGDMGDLLLQARIDTLLRFGALDEARLLLGTRPPDNPALFRRWFDIALLTGAETEACRYLAELPDLSPTYPARIFCLARNGDWQVAALTLGTAESLGILTPDEDALLARFLDPELFETVPPRPRQMTPLIYRLFEAAGERLPTATLPLAFAHADLAPILGWKTRLEASERLARAGVLSPGALFEVYAERKSAASGGVWDRVSDVARLNTRLSNGSARAADYSKAYRRMEAAGLGAVFAQAYRALPEAPETDAERRDLLRISAAQGRRIIPGRYLRPGNRDDLFLAAVALGDPSTAPAPSALGRAVADGFRRAEFDGTLSDLAAVDRQGRALLLALQWIAEARSGDPDRLGEAIWYLRSLGLEETARRIALDLLLGAQTT
ncbi:MAG: hypothetical protein AAF871_05030 [Pseudomonadota bacterium]